MRVSLSGSLTTSRVLSRAIRDIEAMEEPSMDQIAQLLLLEHKLTTYFFHNGRVIHLSLGKDTQVLVRRCANRVLMQVYSIPLAEMTQGLIDKFTQNDLLEEVSEKKYYEER